MANTYTLISSVTVGAGGASSIDFTSIPATYTDLLVRSSLRTTTGGFDAIAIKLNNSSASFTERELSGNGAGASSSSASNNYAGVINGSTSTASTFSNTDTYIPNYAGSTNKSLSTDSVTENNATTSYARFEANLWSNTSAINQVTLTCAGGSNFAQHSTAYLYGIKNS